LNVEGLGWCRYTFSILEMLRDNVPNVRMLRENTGEIVIPVNARAFSNMRLELTSSSHRKQYR
jgi:hypothetical protein